jgi:hypothetical protein
MWNALGKPEDPRICTGCGEVVENPVDTFESMPDDIVVVEWNQMHWDWVVNDGDRTIVPGMATIQYNMVVPVICEQCNALSV